MRGSETQAAYCARAAQAYIIAIRDLSEEDTEALRTMLIAVYNLLDAWPRV